MKHKILSFILLLLGVAATGYAQKTKKIPGCVPDR